MVNAVFHKLEKNVMINLMFPNDFISVDVYLKECIKKQLYYTLTSTPEQM